MDIDESLWKAEVVDEEGITPLVKITRTYLGDSSQHYIFLTKGRYMSTHSVAACDGNEVVLFRIGHHLKPRVFMCVNEKSAIEFCAQLNDLF